MVFFSLSLGGKQSRSIFAYLQCWYIFYFDVTLFFFLKKNILSLSLFALFQNAFFSIEGICLSSILKHFCVFDVLYAIQDDLWLFRRQTNFKVSL